MAGKKRKLGWYGRLLIISVLAAALVFLPTTIVLMFGMIPTAVAALVDRHKERTLALTVGAMNLAGCMPFLLDLWTETEHKLADAVHIIANPVTIIVMYSAAGIGWLIYLNMTAIVAAIVIKRHETRLKQIRERLDELLEDWGEEVTGKIMVDKYGMPINPDYEDEGSVTDR